MSPTARYLAFLPMHTPSKHRVLAVVDRGDGAVVEAVATFPDPTTAVALADGLTGALLRQVDALARVTAALDGAPDSVRSAVTSLLANMAAGGADDEPQLSRIAAALRRPFGAGFDRFPTHGCPPDCPVCTTGCRTGCADCPACRDDECDVCVLPPAVTPRTAAVLHHVAGLLADEVYDDAERGRFPGQAAPEDMVLPEVVRGQHQHVFRRMARAFDDLAGDLAAGRLPLPACMAEEIALDILIEQARDMGGDLAADGMIKLDGLPATAYDFAWDRLQDVLFQDKDYGGYLYAADAAGPGELDHWFEEFNNVAPRDPHRGFRR
jgi:hypothetical protein